MKQYELINEGKNRLMTKGVPDADTDAVLLWLFCSGISRTDYILNRDDEVKEEKTNEFFSLIDKRCERIPLQYITGKQCFMGFDFNTSENVLIPRFDTETLVEQVDIFIKNKFGGKTVNVLDMCCGSGCIGISVKLMNENARVDLSDISDYAIELTKKNAIELHADCNIIKSDLFEKINGKYDIIISNPPYIESHVIEELMPEVRDHEPLMALDGDVDGLKFYKQIILDAEKFLNENGYIFFEIGNNQAHDVEQLLVDNHFTDIHVVKDLCKNNRVIYGGLSCLTN